MSPSLVVVPKYVQAISGWSSRDGARAPSPSPSTSSASCASSTSSTRDNWQGEIQLDGPVSVPGCNRTRLVGEGESKTYQTNIKSSAIWHGCKWNIISQRFVKLRDFIQFVFYDDFCARVFLSCRAVNSNISNQIQLLIHLFTTFCIKRIRLLGLLFANNYTQFFKT